MLKQKIKDPYVLVTSPAFRAYETAVIFARILGYDTEKIILRESLYSPANLKSFAVITEELDEKYNTVILFGHNPSFTEIPDILSISGCDIVPKSGIVSLSFKAKMERSIWEKGSVEFFLNQMKYYEQTYIPKEISWLSFNERVLQEAETKMFRLSRVPLSWDLLK